MFANNSWASFERLSSVAVGDSLSLKTPPPKHGAFKEGLATVGDQAQDPELSDSGGGHCPCLCNNCKRFGEPAEQSVSVGEVSREVKLIGNFGGLS